MHATPIRMGRVEIDQTRGKPQGGSSVPPEFCANINLVTEVSCDVREEEKVSVDSGQYVDDVAVTVESKDADSVNTTA